MRFVIVISLLMILGSCSDKFKIKRTMSEFVKSNVVIPDDLECIYKDDVYKINVDSLKPMKYIVYYDSLECNSCKVSGVSQYKPLLEMADSSNFSVMFIFSPKDKDIDLTRLNLLMANLNVPIFLDVNKAFAKNNLCIPEDNRFNSFLLNDAGNPIFVGNPLSSTSLWTLFNDVVKQYNANN